MVLLNRLQDSRVISNKSGMAATGIEVVARVDVARDYKITLAMNLVLPALKANKAIRFVKESNMHSSKIVVDAQSICVHLTLSCRKHVQIVLLSRREMWWWCAEEGKSCVWTIK